MSSMRIKVMQSTGTECTHPASHPPRLLSKTKNNAQGNPCRTVATHKKSEKIQNSLPRKKSNQTGLKSKLLDCNIKYC